MLSIYIYFQIYNSKQAPIEPTLDSYTYSRSPEPAPISCN